MKALVIDDSRSLRRILGGMLRELGFEVTEAGNGAEGLATLESVEQPDVVLVDWNMPVMSGLEFVQVVRSQPRFEHLPLMMVTTETEIEQVGTALEAGVNEYVMKPFDKRVIVEKLQLLGVAV
jgi:two-component system, chemotaxis family, chemotaxis protein CheY